MTIIDTLSSVIDDWLTAQAAESAALKTYQDYLASEPAKPIRVVVASDYTDYLAALATFESTRDGYYSDWRTARAAVQTYVDAMLTALPITNVWFKVPVDAVNYALGKQEIEGETSLRLEAWSDTIPGMYEP